MWASRSPWRSPRRATRWSAWTSTPAGWRRWGRAAATSRTSPTDLEPLRAAAGDHPLRGSGLLRGDDRLRPDPADDLARARSHLPRRLRDRALAGPPAGPAGRPRVDDLPGDHPGAPAADPRGVGDGGGSDFHLAFSPERIDPGRTDYTVRTTPKLVGGLTERCAERAEALYREICDEVVVVSSARRPPSWRSCWRTSSARSTSRFVNELAQLCDRLGHRRLGGRRRGRDEALRLHAL